MPEIPDLHIFFLTVGEKVALESLRALKERTHQPYKLTIWYDSCGREIDWNFYKSLQDYSDDIFLLTKNHGTSGALAYSLLYLDGKYILIVLADTVVQEGYLDRFHFALSHMEKIACAGSFRLENVPWDFLINSREFMPDGVQIFDREAINEIGGISSAFRGMGLENREWHERAISKGWNVVSCRGIMKEMGSTHDGRNMNTKVQDEIEKSSRTYLNITDGKWNGFNWWDNRWDKNQSRGELINA